MIFLVALLAFSIASAQLSDAATPSQEFPVADTSSDQLSPAVGANKIVVWEDKRDGQSNIYGKNLATGQEFLVASSLSAKRKPVTNGIVVVWEDDRAGNSDIYAYRIPSDLSTTGESCVIASGPGEQRKPVISGGTVVWQDDRSGRWEIYSSKIPADCSTPAVETLVSTGGGNKTNPSISGDTVVWQDDRGIPGTSDIYAKELSTGREFPVSTGASFMDTPAISGSIVVWRQESPNNYDIFGKDLMAKDLETGKVFQITTDGSDQVSPAISGNIVVWEDHRNGAANVYGKDLSTGVEFQITSGATPTTSPQINGKTVVWESQYQGTVNYGNYDVLGTDLDVAPGAPNGVKATGTTTGVGLNWVASSESDVVGYNVYRSGSAAENFEKLNATGTLATPSYTDASAPKGEASFYRVTALDRSGNESAPSTAISAAALAQTGVSFEAFPLRLNLGEATTISGKLMKGDVPLSGKPIVIERSAAGRNTFGLVAGGKLTTGSDGSFLLANVKPQGDTDYRVRYAGDTRTGLLASTSPTRRVEVAIPGSLSLIASPLTVNYGRATALSGRLTKNGAAVAGKRVVLEHRPLGAAGFSALRQVNTNATGNYSFAGLRPAKHTDYRVRFAGDKIAGLQPTTSAVRRVNVRASVSVNVSDTSVTAGQVVRISGMVSPLHAGSVKLTIKGSGRVVTETSISTSSSQSMSTPSLIDSQFALTYKPPAPGTYEVVVTFDGDADHLGSSSVVRSFQVTQ